MTPEATKTTTRDTEIGNQPQSSQRQSAAPAMNDPTLPLSGLSSVRGKSVIARFDGGMLSSNGGVLALAEVERRLDTSNYRRS